MPQFLNRLLALPIALQNALFAVFEDLLETRIEEAMAAGIYDAGVETLKAESFVIAERRTVYTHAATGAETRCYQVKRKDLNRPLTLDAALEKAYGTGCRLLLNEQSGRAAVQIPAASLMDDDGGVQARLRLIRPMGHELVLAGDFGASRWREAEAGEFAPVWQAECARVPGFATSTFHIITARLPIWNRLLPPISRLPLRDGRWRARHRAYGYARGAQPRL
jgi:hypothetical protein